MVLGSLIILADKINSELDKLSILISTFRDLVNCREGQIPATVKLNLDKMVKSLEQTLSVLKEINNEFGRGET